MLLKKQIIEAIENMPDESSTEDLIERIVAIQKLDEETLNNDWSYNCFIENELLHAYVNPPLSKKVENPKSLFKYYALNCYSIDALKNSYLYAPEPSELNDPFDCHPNLIKYKEEAEENLLANAKEMTKEYILERSHFQRVAIGLNYYKYYLKIGIISMTTQPDNILMWAHYTQNKGFALEFDIEEISKFFLGPFPINYTENIESVISSDNNDLSPFLRQTNIKSSEWKYEDEWRFLAYRDKPMHITWLKDSKDESLCDRKFRYANCLKSITLGSLFFGNNNIHQWNGQQAVKLTRLNLCVIQFAIQNNIDLYWIENPRMKLLPEENPSFKLTRKRIYLESIDENTYKFYLNS